MSKPLSMLVVLIPALLLGGVSPAQTPQPRAKVPPSGAECTGVLHLSPHAGEAPRAGERLEYELTLGGAYMGRLELSVGQLRKVEGAVAMPLFGRLRTNAFVSAVKPVQGRYMAMVDPRSLAPLGVRMEGTVGEDPRWEHMRFLDAGKKAETRYLIKGLKKQRAYGGEHVILDGLSLLHLARVVALEPGLEACQDILSTRRMWRVRARVMGKELVETPVGPKPAYRVHTSFKKRFGPSTRKIEIDVLLGDLPGRPPLAFEMTQNQFSGRAHLIRWKPGRG